MHELLKRLTAIYITVMSVRLALVFIDSLKLLSTDERSATHAVKRCGETNGAFSKLT